MDENSNQPMSQGFIGTSAGVVDVGPTPTSPRELTFGEKAVGLAFNPGRNSQVDTIKAAYAAIIDQLNDARTAAGQGETGRLFSVAITEAQSAQMWAVKAITLPE